MGFIAKSHRQLVYGSLLRLYPQSFQKKYSKTMQQTFNDMLDDEKTGFGRSIIWSRALIDLPLTASKEHISNGKDFNMNRNIKLIIAATIIAFVVVGLGSFWEGNLRAKSNIGIERVTTVQLADAMQQDDFYNTYGDTVVLFTGNVASTKTKGNVSLVTFDTGHSYNVVCQFSKTNSLSIGQSVSVAAPAGSAERESNGVLLHNCIQN